MFTENIFAIIKNGSIIKYPVDPRYESPNVGFPLDWPGGKIGGKEYVRVLTTPSSIEPIKFGWRAKEKKPLYNKENKVWYQDWEEEFIGFPELKILISSVRYEKEISGLKINGNVFNTDRDSQTKYSLMALNNTKMNWKIDGLTFIEIDIKEINKKVTDYVRVCFETERKYFEIIDKNDIELIKNTNFESGWPDNGQG